MEAAGELYNVPRPEPQPGLNIPDSGQAAKALVFIKAGAGELRSISLSRDLHHNPFVSLNAYQTAEPLANKILVLLEERIYRVWHLIGNHKQAGTFLYDAGGGRQAHQLLHGPALL